MHGVVSRDPPIRLAVVARARYVGGPNRCGATTPSPTAQMSGMLVRRYRSTIRAPLGPVSSCPFVSGGGEIGSDPIAKIRSSVSTTSVSPSRRLFPFQLSENSQRMPVFPKLTLFFLNQGRLHPVPQAQPGPQWKSRSRMRSPPSKAKLVPLKDPPVAPEGALVPVEQYARDAAETASTR